jgi:hypothetical protein
MKNIHPSNMASKYTCSKKAVSLCLYEVAAEIVSFLKQACLLLTLGRKVPYPKVSFVIK